MELFQTTLGQLIYLIILIALGYLLMKLSLIPADTNTALSKLENLVFLPALMLSTFMNNFTAEKLSSLYKILLSSVILEIIIIPIAILIARLTYKTDYLRKIATYGLCFSNFGFMGNAVMQALFPDIFLEYSVFTLPLWIFIMLWGVPTLLMTDEGDGKRLTLGERLKPLINPMLIAMLIGMLIGLTGLSLPTPISSAIDVLGSMMSPVAMLLTGMTLAKSELLSLFGKWRVYILSALRLFVIPIAFMLLFSLIPENPFFTSTTATLAVASLAMPLGLNTIVIPTAYGKDTTDASSMALISHLLSLISIPVVFALLNILVK